jgi:hypothetical protein
MPVAATISRLRTLQGPPDIRGQIREGETTCFGPLGALCLLGAAMSAFQRSRPQVVQ